MCETKVCRACGEEKQLDNFYLTKGKPIGKCKLCVKNKVPIYKDYGEGYKMCSVCSHIKTLEDFHKAKRGRMGRDSVCKQCSNLKPIPHKEGGRNC